MVRIVQTFQPRNRTPMSGIALATSSATTAPTEDPMRYQATRRSMAPDASPFGRTCFGRRGRFEVRAVLFGRRGRCRPPGRGLVGQLDRVDGHGPNLAAAVDAEIDGSPDGLATKASLEVADTLDRVAVELEHDVTDAQAGARRGTRLQQLHDLETARPSDPCRDRLGQRAGAADDPEEGAPDAPVDDQRIEDPARRVVDRHGQAESDPGDRRVDPDDPA